MYRTVNWDLPTFLDGCIIDPICIFLVFCYLFQTPCFFLEMVELSATIMLLEFTIVILFFSK
jgi:hypothetical protein